MRRLETVELSNKRLRRGVTGVLVLSFALGLCGVLAYGLLPHVADTGRLVVRDAKGTPSRCCR